MLLGSLLADRSGVGSSCTLERMANSNVIAYTWIETLACREEIPFASKLREQFRASVITRLCDCGCNSFDCSIQQPTQLQPLCSPGAAGAFFEVAFSAGHSEPIDVVFFADNQGYLAGVDIHYGLSNSGPMPEQVTLDTVIYSTPEATFSVEPSNDQPFP